MRALFSVVLCVLVVFVRAENYVLGEREHGDHLVTDRIVYKHASHHCVSNSTSNTTATITVKALDPNDVIDWVEISSKNNVSYTLIKGNIGENSLTVSVTEEGCNGLYLHVIAYAINSSKKPKWPCEPYKPDEPCSGSGSGDWTYDLNDSSFDDYSSK